MDDASSYIDISQDTRALVEVIRDQWFYADQITEPVTLTVKQLLADANKPDEAILVFDDEERWLRLNRENRLVFNALFESPAASIGKQITITSAPNWKRVNTIKILPPEFQPPKPLTKSRRRQPAKNPE